MGKAEEEEPLPSTPLDAQGTNPASGSSNGCCLSCSRLRKSVTFRCVFVLVLGVAVLLSAVFWLPFFHLRDHKDLDLDYAGHDIVASFMLRKPASSLEDHILQLQRDIFDEISFSSVKVDILSVDPSAEPNITKVLFAVESDLTTQSLIRDSFMYLILRRSVFQLTASLFGDPFSFEVLKFKGGITASPEQKAFLMQSGQIRFNFTLNFSIDEILNNFDELRSQLRTGLHLAPYENLYISLTNLKGSTVAPPTTVESKVLLAVGINFTKSRIKQLAQTITGSHSKNLGLNNTVFGQVKQVRLSSILQHSLSSDGSGPSPLPSPSPSPSPSPLPQSHFHHHPHPHHPESSPASHISPSPSMGSHGSATGRGSPTSTPVPAPAKNKAAAPPPACHFGNGNKLPWKHNTHPHVTPAAVPGYAPNAAPSQPTHTETPLLKRSLAPAPSPPHVVHAHSHPPSEGKVHAMPLDVMASPSPSPSSAGITCTDSRAGLPVALVILMIL
ncbi:hydroxyproline-rich glycoprotein family protein [Perilla frutescens var. hirtella]|uniref:Hydroxyproline-rich glycoprotein family protein n=1 Tax=Perilla frutescens var. hirtella TaxID=608512 RepID=A0AAD4JEV1_PERFH|nr:hydroxyproline-rich glycoprotein family protein [Perilla frutescens var. hirtella]